MKLKQRVVILAVLFTGIDLLDAQETVPAEPPATQDAQTDRRIRFNFEHQPWTEVLQFLADQADLSLVLDSPPEGSFNYSDSRDYAPREAIDLVNGVLATKGYTLLRRERMLMLVNLQSGVPKTLVPRITIEELDRRGQFELVMVTFPLSERSLDSTVTEVTPLLSNYGEISPLPASQQLLVTDRAGVVRAIKAAIDSIPLPKKSSSSQPQKPELRVYPLEGADPVATIEMLNALVKSKLVHDPVAKTINANATPSEHALLEKVIEQMQGNAETSRYRMEVYPLEGVAPGDVTQLINDLSLVKKNGQIRYDESRKGLVVWADASEQAEIRRTLLRLLASISTGGRPSAKVYVLEHGDPAAIEAAVRKVMPQVRLMHFADSSRILAIATIEDHNEIAVILEQLDHQVKPTELKVQIYNLKYEPLPSLPNVLKRIVPKAEVMIEQDMRRVTVTATSKDQAAIAQVIEQLDLALPKTVEQSLEVYVLDDVQRKRFPPIRDAITQADPQVKLVWDASSGELYAWASEAKQAEISQLLEAIRSTPPTSATNQVVAYAVTGSDMASMLEIISAIAPAAKAIADTKGRRVLVWATAKDHQAIAPIVQPTAATNRETGDLNYRAYPTTGIDSSLAIQLLNDRYPAAEFMADSQTGTIVAKASNEQQLQIAMTLETLRRGASSNNIREVQVYPLAQMSPEKAQALASLFPTMELHVDSALHQIAALGTRTEHDQLRTALNSLRDGVSDSTRRVKLYNLGEASASTAAKLLAPIVPGATMVPDPASKTLGIWATDDQHAQLQSLIDQWLEQQSAKDLQEVLIVELEHARATDILSVMREILPNTMVTSVGDKQLVIRGNMNERQLATGVIQQTDVPRVGENRQMKIYPATNVKIDEAMAAIKEYFGSSFNDIRFVVQHNSNRVVVFAKDEEQTKIADIFKQLQLPDKKLEVFRLQIVDPVFAESAINELFMNNSIGMPSDVTVEVDEHNGQLLVKARPDDLEKVREVLVQLGEIALLTENDRAANQNSRFVPLEYGFTEDLLTQLRAHWNKMAPNELQVLRAGALNSSQVDNQAQPDEPSQNTEDSASSPADESSTGTGPPPVTLVVNVDGVTIMSDDTKAVFKLETLLRAMSRQTFTARVDFSVFNLKHSSASRVSKLLSEIYVTSNQLPFSDRVRVTADDRLNSIVVFGSRSKRREVGALLQTLDSKQFADLTLPGPPVMIQLQYASAERVEEKLQVLYKTQLSVVGGRPPIEIPPGADPQVVATLQQINAAREGPLLSLEVDRASNSLLVVGTDPLVEEIRTFAGQLDHETAQSRVGIRVVPLETLRGDEVVKSLKKLFNK